MNISNIDNANYQLNNACTMGIYIHIPFCVSNCVYCDFLSAPADDATKEAYMQALIREIEYVAGNIRKYGDVFRQTDDAVKDNHNRRQALGNRVVKTIFFGGGTPSVVKAEHIAAVLDCIRKYFPVDEEAEITIECNPGTLDRHKAGVYRKAGINRISFGLQSADDKVLKMLGRIHTFADFEESVRIARDAGFDNINVDVMSALPGQSLEDYVKSLEKILFYDVEHISAYSLIVEEGTLLGDNLSDFPQLPDEDTEREMYYETDRILKEHGFERYEISNYGKNITISSDLECGNNATTMLLHCKHNLSYWDRVDYLGFGIGAASYYCGRRMNNISDLTEYINRAGKMDVYDEITHLSKEDMMEEFMFLGLRKMCGVSFSDFKTEFGVDINDVYGEVLTKNVAAGLLEYTESGVKLTSRGVDVSNIVLAEFLF